MTAISAQKRYDSYRGSPKASFSSSNSVWAMEEHLQAATWARDRGVIEKLACLSWQHFSSGTKWQTLMGSFYSHGVKSCICCTIFLFAIFQIVTPIWTERTKRQLMLLVRISSSCFFFLFFCFWRLWIGMLLVVNVFVFLQQRVAASCTTTKWLPPLC